MLKNGQKQGILGVKMAYFDPFLGVLTINYS